jgi:Uma2 family endonuclease
MSTTSTALMTAEEFMELPDDDLRHELINGEVVTMPLPKFPHGRAAMRLGGPLTLFVEEHDLGEVFDEVGYQLTWAPDTVLGPDLSFVSNVRLNEVVEVTGYWQGAPDIAVEVLSPGDRPGKVKTKISRWLSSGAQVWIVDPKRRTVTVYRSEADSTTFSGSDCLESQDLLPGFRLPLDRIFGPTPVK